MSNYIQTNQTIFLEYADLTINESDSGKILITPQTANATDVDFTLPSPATAGLHYRFINGADNDLDGSVQIVAEAKTLYGSAITGPVAGVALLNIDGNTTIRFLTAVSVLGDFIDLYSDGENWIVDARSRVAGGITVT